MGSSRCSRAMIIFMIICNILLLISGSSSNNTSCSEACKTDQAKFRRHGKTFDSCSELPVLDARLHWTYSPPNRTVAVAYRAAQPCQRGWVSWGLNLLQPNTMVGTQALFAYGNADGSVSGSHTRIDSYHPDMRYRKLSIGVADMFSEYGDGHMTIYATLGPLDGRTSFNHVWQAGSTVHSRNRPTMHLTSGDNLRSMGTVQFYTK